jgi:hypothetical protein
MLRPGGSKHASECSQRGRPGTYSGPPRRFRRGAPAGAAPDPASLALVRRALGGLLGAPLPARLGRRGRRPQGHTGREPLTEAGRGALGRLAARFPLFA